MILHQIALGLEIFGFLLATIFAGILFNREVVGKWADNMNAKFISLSKTLNKHYVPMVEYLLKSKWPERVAPTIIITTGEICIIIGWLIDITWLFWIGLIVISPYVLIVVPFGTFLVFRNDPRMSSIWQFPAYLLGSLTRTFILSPPVLTLFLIYILLFTILTFILSAVAGKDIIKKWLIIIGSTIVIIGLTLELIATM